MNGTKKNHSPSHTALTTHALPLAHAMHRRSFRTHRCLWLLLALGLWTGPGWAQTPTAPSAAIRAQQFRPSLDPNGMFLAHSAETLGHLAFQVGMAFNYAYKPLLLQVDKPGGAGRHIDILRHQLGLDLALGIGLFTFWDITVSLPMTLYQDGQVPDVDTLGSVAGRPLSGFAMGDMQLRTRLQPLSQSNHGINIGVLLALGIPTGNEQVFNGEEGVSFAGALLISRYFYRFEFAVNLGYRYQPESQLLDLTVGHELFYNVGLSFGVVPQRFDVVVDIDGIIGISGGPSRANSPLGAMVGARIFPMADRSFAIYMGAGMGVFKGYGSPGFRTFFGLVWHPAIKRHSRSGARSYRRRRRTQRRRRRTRRRRKRRRRSRRRSRLDQDGDGIANRYDRCPDLPGSRRRRGCPRRILVAYSSKKRRIYVKRGIYFQGDKIHPRSEEVLQQVAWLMRSYPRMKLRITVTTLSRGRKAWSLKRSWRFAKAIKRDLRRRGVARRRILIRGKYRYHKRRRVGTEIRFDVLRM